MERFILNLKMEQLWQRRYISQLAAIRTSTTTSWTSTRPPTDYENKNHQITCLENLTMTQTPENGAKVSCSSVSRRN